MKNERVIVLASGVKRLSQEGKSKFDDLALVIGNAITEAWITKQLNTNAIKCIDINFDLELSEIIQRIR